MRKERGKPEEMPRVVKFIVVHAGAAHENEPEPLSCHFHIQRDGRTVQDLQLNQIGKHAKGFNRCSIGVCCEGGQNRNGSTEDTRTKAQRSSMQDLIGVLKQVFPNAMIVAHNQLKAYDGNNACPGILF